MKIELTRSLPGIAGLALACMTSAGMQPVLAQGTATFINQVQIQRSPDDVALTPNSALAVIRGVDAISTSPQVHQDEITIIRANNGKQVAFPAQGCTNHGLTRALGASDLVAATNTRGVLIGEHHYGSASNWKTCVDIVDLSQAIGTGPTCLLNWEKIGAGDVSDVAITPDERFAVVNHKGFIHVFDIQATPFTVYEFPVPGAVPGDLRDSVASPPATARQPRSEPWSSPPARSVRPCGPGSMWSTWAA